MHFQAFYMSLSCVVVCRWACSHLSMFSSVYLFKLWECLNTEFLSLLPQKVMVSAVKSSAQLSTKQLVELLFTSQAIGHCKSTPTLQNGFLVQVKKDVLIWWWDHQIIMCCKWLKQLCNNGRQLLCSCSFWGVSFTEQIRTISRRIYHRSKTYSNTSRCWLNYIWKDIHLSKGNEISRGENTQICPESERPDNKAIIIFKIISL